MNDGIAESPARQRYEDEGFVLFRGVLDPALTAEMRDHIDWLLARNPGTRPEQLHHYLATRDAFWVRVASDDRLLDIAEQFIGPDIALYGTHYIAKRPRDGQAVLWHQDGSYWPLEPMTVVTLWVAIDPSDPENGCMRVVPRTHREALMPLTPTSRTDVVLDSFLDPAKVDESAAVDLILGEGDVSVHHPNVIHGSNANVSERWRRCLTLRYIPASTRILKVEPGTIHPSAFHFRGEDPGVNRYHPRPRYVEGESMPFAGCEAWA